MFKYSSRGYEVGDPMDVFPGPQQSDNWEKEADCQQDVLSDCEVSLCVSLLGVCERASLAATVCCTGFGARAWVARQSSKRRAILMGWSAAGTLISCVVLAGEVSLDQTADEAPPPPGGHPLNVNLSGVMFASLVSVVLLIFLAFLFVGMGFLYLYVCNRSCTISRQTSCEECCRCLAQRPHVYSTQKIQAVQPVDVICLEV